MVWLFLVGLAVWILVLQSRLAATERQLRNFQTPKARLAEPSPVVVPQAAPVAPPQPAAAPPLPPMSTLVEEPAHWREQPPAGPRPTQEAVAEAAPRLPTTSAPRPALSTWLSESGLAWVGGGALVLGGALLVAYAAERGFFTPPLRIAAALILGAAMLGVGEWLRRLTGAPGGRPALAAAIVSGAGASTLYAAIWAAYALYDFLPLTAAAVLLAAISLGLLALAVLHGEALALLALAGAFAVPILCRQPNWSDVALDGYVALITATGLAAVALRNWGWAGLLSLVLAAGWIFGREVVGDASGAAGLIVTALALTLLAVRRGGVQGAPEAEPGTRYASTWLPAIACVGASVLWTLLAFQGAKGTFVAEALAGAAVSLLCAAAVRMKLVQPGFIGAPAAALVLTAQERLGTFGFGATPFGVGPSSVSTLWFLVPVAALAGSALALRLADKARAEVGVIGAVACALTLTLLRAPMAAALAGDGWLVFVLAAALFAAGAVQMAFRSTDAASDLAVAAWIGAGAEAVGLAIHTTVAGLPEPLAYGLLALALALTARRLSWRGLPEAAALAALVSLLSLLGPHIAGDALAGHLAWTDLALAGAGGVLAQSAAWWVLRGRAGATPATEATSTSALIAGLLSIFLLLRLWATPHGAHAASLDTFTEAALRTVLLITAGLVLSVRGGPGAFSRARGPVFLIAGAAHGVLFGVLTLNPWWGFGGPTDLVGPPVFDVLALAYLAPALLLAAAARRQAATLARAAPWTALTALGILIVWAAMEIRRLFHGPDLASGPFGYAEVAAYGAALIALAWLVTLAAVRVVVSANGAAAAAGAVARWIALVASTWLLCVVASPWWGPLEGAFATPALFFALFAGAPLLTALFARHAATAATPVFREAVKVAVTLEVFAVLTLAIRFAFHGAAMRVSLHEASVETWTFSAAWAVYGLVILATGARGGDRALRWLGLAVLIVTTLKVFLFDMATLQGVIRAGSFLALGVLLLIGAVAARRLGSGAKGRR